jgi:hypothetical protein
MTPDSMLSNRKELFMRNRRIWLVLIAALCLISAGWIGAQTPATQPSEPTLTEEQTKDFLLHANVTASRHTSQGITSPWRLTLSDGKITHDAIFQSVDERKSSMQLADGRTEINFVDSYHYNIAGYELGKLLGLGDVIPVYVGREWNRQQGALGWWVTVKMDEGTRLKQKLEPPNPDAWNKQMFNLRVFDQLIYDTDANLTNFLITADWKLWRVDFSRAFRLSQDLQGAKDLPMVGRDLLAKLEALKRDEVLANTKPHLTNSEVAAVMARRDKLVAHFKQLVAQQGESKVLF